jgi:hypothetical protein
VPGDGATNVVATIAGVGGGASASRAVTVDTVGPATAIAPVTGDDVITLFERGGFTISGTTEANATVAVTLGGRVDNVTANGAGAWQSGLFGGLDLPVLGGAVQVTATATDRFGNPGAPQVRVIQVEGIPIGIASEPLSPAELLSAGDAAIPGAGAGSADAVTSAASLASSSINPLADPLLAIHDPLHHLA